MQLVLTPDKVLTGRAQPIAQVDDKIRKIIEDMKVVLKESKIGVGLAAPQVGLPIQLFIAAPSLAKSTQTIDNPYKVFINPKIINIVNSKQQTANSKKKHLNSKNAKKKSSNSTLEGCLSIPNIWGHVKRSSGLTLTYLDENGISHTEKFTGFMATIIQHEVDHLNGILFTHHVMTQKEKLYQQVKDEETGKWIMEEIEL